MGYLSRILLFLCLIAPEILGAQTKIGISGYIYKMARKNKFTFNEWIFCMPSLRVYSINDKDVLYSKTSYEYLKNFKNKTFTLDGLESITPIATRIAHISLHHFVDRYEIISQLNLTPYRFVGYNPGITKHSFSGNIRWTKRPQTMFPIFCLQFTSGVSYYFPSSKPNKKSFINTSFRYNFILDRSPLSTSDYDYSSSFNPPEYYWDFVNYPTDGVGFSEICLAFGRKIDNELIKGVRLCYDVNNFKKKYFYASIEFYRIMYISSIKKRDKHYYEKFE